MPRGQAAPEERLRAIETLLLWEGRVTRGRLLELFAVHATVASRDILAYRRQFPGACEADTASKAYEAGVLLRPVLTEGHFTEYQALIGAAGNEPLSGAIAIESSHVDSTQISYQHFARIHAAIRMGSCVRITYRSMRNPSPHGRILRPHALIQAGARWHMRGYCSEARDFREFNLGRLTAVETVPDLELPSGEDDTDWQITVNVRLVPHQALNPEQQSLVRDEYMGGTTAAAFEVRKPMARYLVQAFRAAIDPLKETPPSFLLMVHEPSNLPQGTLWRE